jgi:multidrug efflux pump subunit AcrA (membrane-fusion protein)
MSSEREEFTLVRAAYSADRVLIADVDPHNRQWMREICAGVFALDECPTSESALEQIALGMPRIVVIGRNLADISGAELLDRAIQWLGDRDAPIATFLIADSQGAMPDVDDARVKIVYRLVRSMQSDRVLGLFKQATQRLPAKPPLAQREFPPEVNAHAARIGQVNTTEDAARVAVEAVVALTYSDRARCVFCDEDSGALWAEGTMTMAVQVEREGYASTGLVGFAVRTVASIAVPHASDDALYNHDIDDPRGHGRERILVQPVTGLDGHVHAVLIALREPDKRPFTEYEVGTLEALATAWQPYLEVLAMRVEADNILGDQLDKGPSEMFRQEAIVHMVRRGARGDVVRVHPGWVRAAYWLVLLSLVGAVTFAALAHVHQYTEGPAIVRYTGRSDVVAFEAGTIAALDVTRGQTVVAGQALARLHDNAEIGRLNGLENEFERKLVQYLQNPADPAVKQALAQIKSQRDTAKASLDSRVIKAPHAGVVKEVLVRNGQHVDPGKVVLSIVETGASEGLTVLAFVPGTDRPRLRAHQTLSLTLPGYRNARIAAEVRAVSSEVLGAAEARARYLGERVGDSLPLNGSVVVVEARLATGDFDADGQNYQLHDGMTGIAEIQLQSHTVLESLLPGRLQ